MNSKIRNISAVVMGCVIAFTAGYQTSAKISAESADVQDNSCIYEGIFLENDEINAIFGQIRESAPFENVTKDFHITTEFMPEKDHKELYGEKVGIHITSYKIGEIPDDEGNMTSNEGLKAYITSDNDEFQVYLDSLDKNFHITGAYKDKAKYTEYIDFADGMPLDIYVEGTFGGYYSDGNIVFGS